VVETGYLVSLEVDRLRIEIGRVLRSRDWIEMCMVVSICEEYGDESTTERLLEWDVYHSLLFEIDEGAQAKFKTFEVTRSSVWISIDIGVEALLKLN